MDIHRIFLILSSLLAICAPVFYVYDIFKRGAKPHRTTRLVLMVITGLAALSLYAQNNISVVWFASISFFSCLTIFLLSLKYGVGGWQRLDLLCLGIAIIGIIIWKITNDPIIALYASILADFTGVFPTLVKTYKLPKTESLRYFSINLFASGFNVLAVTNFSIVNVSYPLYLVLVNLMLVIFILKPRFSKFK